MCRVRCPDRTGAPESLLGQRTERQRLGRCPIYPFAGFDHFAPSIEEALHRRMDLETLRHGGDLRADLLQLSKRDAVAPRRASSPSSPVVLRPVHVRPASRPCWAYRSGPPRIRHRDGRSSRHWPARSRPGRPRLRRSAGRRRFPSVDGCARISMYITGWVKAGSSPSLWP